MMGVGGGAGGCRRRGCRGVVLQELAGRVEVQVVGKILEENHFMERRELRKFRVVLSQNSHYILIL